MEKVAVKTGVDTAVVAARELYFFNVRDRLDAFDWILINAIDVVPGTVLSEGKIRRHVAVAGGPVVPDILVDDLHGRPDADVGFGFCATAIGHSPSPRLRALGRKYDAPRPRQHCNGFGMSDVTHILRAIDSGDPRAASDLLPLVYDELRKLAARRMREESPGHTLGPTALVKQAYVRLVGTDEPGWQNRGRFFAAAAEAMRRILIESARRKAAAKHGGGRAREPLDDALLNDA